MQEDSASPSPSAGEPASSDQVIDEHEYRALVERVQMLRTQVQSLSRPTDFNPWHFFAMFDRVHLKPGYVPDFVFTPIEMIFPFGSEWWPELTRGAFTLTTRRVIWPPLWWWPIAQLMAHFLPQKAPRARIRRRPRLTSSIRRGLHLRLQQGFKGLVFERSAWGFLQFAVFCLEVDRWSRQRVGDWQYAADWQWVCSREQLEARVPKLRLSSPPASSREPFDLTAEQWQWLRSRNPQLHVRIRGTKAEVRGLAFSPWEGFGWLDCDLTWPNRFSIRRLEELGINRTQRPVF